jgi:hypothetical protein
MEDFCVQHANFIKTHWSNLEELFETCNFDDFLDILARHKSPELIKQIPPGITKVVKISSILLIDPPGGDTITISISISQPMECTFSYVLNTEKGKLNVIVYGTTYDFIHRLDEVSYFASNNNDVYGVNVMNDLFKTLGFSDTWDTHKLFHRFLLNLCKHKYINSDIPYHVTDVFY